jgi:ABC-type bacteriocin/lantibiotic exporter with double-glycine peptidase domain
LNEALAGYIESNIYQRKKFFAGRYEQYQLQFNRDLAGQMVMQNLPSRMMEVFAVFGLFLLVAFNSYFAGSDPVSVILIGSFIAAAYKIIPGISKILNARDQVNTYGYTIDDILYRETEITAPVTNHHQPIRSVSCSQVNFSYQDELIVSNFNMELRQGEFAGLSAVSGRGKTTILHLLLGFLEPVSGEILINDARTTAVDRKAYWPRISYSRQQSFLIHDSLRHNITLSEEQDEDRLREVIRVTGIESFTREEEINLDMPVTEGGKNISGGQRQRIMVARALYRDADLYILDEPFNELDKSSARQLLSYLQAMSGKGKMILLVTHDPESLAYCSKIISMDER